MKFSRPKRVHISLLAIGIILGIGCSSGMYWLLFAPKDNGQSLDAATHNPTGISQPTTREPNASDVVPSSSLPSLYTLRRLEDLEEIRSPFDRDLALQVRLVFSNETQVARLLSQSMNLSTNDIRYDAQSAIVQKFAQLNPRRALSRVLAMDSQHNPDRLIVAVFREWAHSDLNGAIAQARVLNETRRDSTLRTILEERTDLPEETRKSIAAEVGNEQIAIEVLLEERVEKAMENPEEAWEELVLELQDAPIHRESLVQVALSWIEKNGMSVMGRISTSLTNLQARRGVILGILHGLASSNPSEAFRYALTMENDPFHSAKESVVDVWARSDPQSALAAVSGIEEKTSRETLEKSIAYRWAEKEPMKVLEAVNALPEHVRESTTRTAISKIAENSPRDAAVLVAEMESGDARKYSASTLAGDWLTQDQGAVLNWILNEPAIQDMKHWLLENTLFRIALEDPKLAMETALAQPFADGEMGLEGSVIGAVALSDLNTAIELLPQVREGPTSIYAFREVTGALIRNGDVDEAVDMVHQIPDPKKPDFYTGLVQAWAGNDPSGLLKSMNRLPSKEVQSKAARRLVEINRLRGILTEEQVEQARKFLTEEDSKALEEGADDTFDSSPFVRPKR